LCFGRGFSPGMTITRSFGPRNDVAHVRFHAGEIPSAGDSISTTALSVSISRSGSPWQCFTFFFSPSQSLPFLRHFEGGHYDVVAMSLGTEERRRYF